MVEQAVVSIGADLDGKRIAVTGSTGFLGTALIERLLRSVPGCELVLLIRPGKRSAVGARAKREIFRNDAFDRLRAEFAARDAAPAGSTEAGDPGTSSGPGGNSEDGGQGDSGGAGAARNLRFGSFDDMVAARVQVVAGDVGTDGLGLSDADRATLATCDIVIH